MQFWGEFGTAAARCLQFFSSLQLGRGKWKQQSVADAKGKEVQHFFQTKLEANSEKISCPRTYRFISGLLKAKQASSQKEAGTVTAARRKLAAVLVLDESAIRLDWNR